MKENKLDQSIVDPVNTSYNLDSSNTKLGDSTKKDWVNKVSDTLYHNIPSYMEIEEIRRMGEESMYLHLLALTKALKDKDLVNRDLINKLNDISENWDDIYNIGFNINTQ